MPVPAELPTPDQFAHIHTEKVRYSDTDQLGHVNNTAFTKFLEGGRVSIFYDEGRKLAPDGTMFVIAHISLDYLAEMNWPGDAIVGTSVGKIGRSSVVFEQALFYNKKCVARASSVIVLMDGTTRKSTELTPALRERFASMQRTLD